MSKNKNNAEERVRVVEACISGRLGQSEAARQAGVDESTIREWITITYKLGITNLEFTVGLTENVNKSGDKVNGWLVPRTLRINDKAIDASANAEFVDFIFCKKATESQYNQICYAASNTRLPEIVEPLLTEDIFSTFTNQDKVPQPV